MKFEELRSVESLKKSNANWLLPPTVEEISESFCENNFKDAKKNTITKIK
jgi:hypothetical protein